MPVLTLVSAKGSPGVTTTAAALAAAAVAGGQHAAWIELDPAGGSGWVQGRASVPDSQPTLGDLARAMREDAMDGDWTRFAVSVPPGVPAVLAPTGRPAATTVIAEGGRRWTDVLHQGDRVVATDGGRWSGEPGSSACIPGADVVGLVCRSTLESAEHAWHLVDGLRAAARCPVLAIVVGTKPYDGGEIAAELGLPLAGVMEWRRKDVAALWATGGARTILVRNAARVLAGLLSAVPVKAPGSGSLASVVSTSALKRGSQ